jgi:hypothetical protein
VKNAGQLYGRAQPLDETAAGRAALQQSGLARGRSPGKFISPGKKYPQPHVALPAFDKNGKEAGIWLSPLTDRDGRLEAIGGEGGLWGTKRPGSSLCRTAATARVCWPGTWAKASEQPVTIPTAG